MKRRDEQKLDAIEMIIRETYRSRTRQGLNVRIRPETHAWLKAEAERRKTSLSRLVEALLAQATESDLVSNG